jgi:hypothetical protein
MQLFPVSTPIEHVRYTNLSSTATTFALWLATYYGHGQLPGYALRGGVNPLHSHVHPVLASCLCAYLA